MAKGSIGVVIVAYRSAKTIVTCVESCLTDPRVSAVVVVDNSMEDRCRRLVSEISAGDQRVKYFAGGNVGFSRACNTGERLLGSADLVAFVNPDVELNRALGDLVPHLEATGAAIVSGVLVTPANPEVLNARPLPTAGRALVGAVVGPTRAYTLRWPTDSATHLRVGQVAGALILMGRDTFALLAGFDEQFELYYDDVDLARRAEALGGSVLVLEDWGLHIGGVSADAASNAAYCVGTISRVRYLRKWFGSKALPLAAAIAVLEFVARTASRRSEGDAARLRALALQGRELFSPGSVRVLS